MKIFVTIIILISAFVGCSESHAEECPSGWFDVSFTITIDTAIPRDDFSGVDTDLHYFRETLRLTDEETEQVTQDALEFYNTTYGLNFLSSPVDAAGRRQFENTTLIPFEVPFNVPVIHNRWIINGRKGVNRCFYMKEGGYNAVFNGEQMLHGTYGGKDGRLVAPPSAEGISYIRFIQFECLFASTNFHNNLQESTNVSKP